MVNKMKNLRLFLLTFAFAATAIAAPGDLDTTFGVNGGYVTSNFESLGLSERARDVAIQADGKLVVVGSRATTTPGIAEFYVARFNADGTADNSFNGDGFFSYGPGGLVFVAESVAIQSDGKIVVAGGGGYFFSTAYLFRFNTDGTLDTTFDTDGILTVPSTGHALAVAIQPDGKIVYTTYFDGGAFPVSYTTLLGRLNPNGTPDTTLNGNGIQLVSNSTNNRVYIARGLAIQPDGKYVLAGQSTASGSGRFTIVRLLATGPPDSAFDGDGVFNYLTEFGAARSVVVQPDGKILAGGGIDVSIGQDAALIRLNGDGSFDATFDGDGLLVRELAGNNEDYTVEDLALQPDGKILAIAQKDGSFADLITNDFYLFRSNSDGSTDNSFDFNGTVKSQWCEEALGVALLADGRIITAASRDRASDNVSNRATCVQRFNSNGAVDYTFNPVASNGKTTFAGFGLTDLNSVAALPNGKIIVAGSLLSDNGSIVEGAAMRLNADGSIDTSFMNEGFYIRNDFPSGGDNVFHDIRVLPDGGFIIAGESGSRGGTLFKFTPAGALDTTYSGDGITSSTSASRFYGSIVQSDGKIVGCGSLGTTTRSGRLIRFSLTGTAELTATNNMGASGNNNEILECGQQSDGKIIVAGYGHNSGLNTDFVSVGRHLSTLTIDTTFGASGVSTLDLSPTVNDRATDLVIQPDNKVVVSSTGLNGAGDRDFAVVRFDANGTPDQNLAENFGTNGVSLIDFVVGNPNDEASALLVQPDGQFLVAGSTDAGTGRRFGLAKINPGGAPALGFGTLGRTAFPFPGDDATASAIALYLNDRVIVAGKAWNGTDFDFAIARFQNELVPTAASVAISGRVTTAKGGGIANVFVSLTDVQGNIRTVKTNTFGFYRFDELTAGATYVLNVSSKRFSFNSPSRLVTLKDSVFDEDFSAIDR